MASQGENNEIVTHLHIMNQWMDRITMNLEIGWIAWRDNKLMIMVGFKLGLSKENLKLGELLGVLTLIWMSL
jgi:hypothetical protein